MDTARTDVLQHNELQFFGNSADLCHVVACVEDLCDPAKYPLEEAIRIAKEKAAVREDFDQQISQYLTELWQDYEVDLDKVERTLVLFVETAPLERLLRLLRSAMTRYDPHVRSRSAAAIARHVDSVVVLESLIADADSRVRANVIEALWGRNSPDVEAIFQKSLQDPHHRVAANAVYGLHLLDATRHRGSLEDLINHLQPRYRRAAAWVIRKIGDTDLLPMLKPLICDQMPKVKHAAFRTLAVIRTLKKAA